MVHHDVRSCIIIEENLFTISVENKQFFIIRRAKINGELIKTKKMFWYYSMVVGTSVSQNLTAL